MRNRHPFNYKHLAVIQHANMAIERSESIHRQEVETRKNYVYI